MVDGNAWAQLAPALGGLLCPVLTKPIKSSEVRKVRKSAVPSRVITPVICGGGGRGGGSMLSNAAWWSVHRHRHDPSVSKHINMRDMEQPVTVPAYDVHITPLNSPQV